MENLESRLVEIRQRKEAALEKDLLMYIKSMPESQLKVSPKSIILSIIFPNGVASPPAVHRSASAVQSKRWIFESDGQGQSRALQYMP